MVEWDSLKTNVSQHTEETYQETDTNKIQMKSTKEVKENFELLSVNLLQNALDFLAQGNPNIKKIIEQPELKDLKVKDLKTSKGHINLSLSTSYNRNLRQLLLPLFWPGFKNNIRSNNNWWVDIFFHMHGAFMAIFIDQDTLSK